MLAFIHIVVNEVRIAQHLARPWPWLDGLSNERIAPQGQSTVEQLVANTGRNLGARPVGQSSHDLLEIGDEGSGSG